MKTWFTPQELVGMPGMPLTEKAVRSMAAREQWPARRRERGKGFEYALSGLPERVQSHLRAQQQTAPAPAPSAAPAARAGQLAGRQRAITKSITTMVDESSQQRTIASVAIQASPGQREEAKAGIIDALKRFAAAQNKSTLTVAAEFTISYNRGHELAGITPEITSQIRSISSSSLARWLRRAENGGVHALVGRYQQKPCRIDRQPPLRDFLTALLTEYPHAHSKLMLDAARAHFRPGSGVEIPSHRTVQRWLGRWRRENRALFAAVTNPDGYKNTFMTAFGDADGDVFRLNQRWELDSTIADVQLADGARHALIGVIDVYSRRLLIYVSRTSRASAIAHAVGLAIQAWGIPEQAKFDNGSDYDSAHMQRVWRLLNVEMQRCNPFSPWEKPHIETAFRSFAHDLMEALPGYVGHDVSDREAIRARQAFSERLFKRAQAVEIRMSAEELQQFCNRWCDDVYAHRQHSGIGCAPYERAAAWSHPVRRVLEPRLLDILLAQAPSNQGRRTVNKTGVHIDGYVYVAPELGGCIGQTVLALYDPEDAGCCYLYDGDGKFICRAECPELTGISPQAIAVAARRLQTEQIQAAKKQLKAARRRFNTKQTVERILDDKSAQAKTVIPFNPPAIEHDSAGVQAAKATLAALENRPKAPVLSAEEFAQLRAELEAAERAAEAAAQTPQFNSAEERAYWLAFQAQERPLTALEQTDLDVWRRQYPRAAKEMDELVAARRTGLDLGKKSPASGAISSNKK